MKNKIEKYIIRFFNEELNEEELNYLKESLNSSKEYRNLFNEHNETFQTANKYQFHNNVDARWIELSEKINFRDTTKSGKRFFVNKLTIRVWQSAAVIMFLISILFLGNYILEEPESAVVSVRTQRGQKSEIILADGSKVWLNSGSELLNTGGFSLKNRVIGINGEAFFHVKKNATYPFVVNLKKGKIIVYGTKFNVSSYDDDDTVIVSLEEGSVGFIKKESNSTIIMTPNQQLIYSKKSGKIKLHHVNTDLYTSWKDNRQRFSNATFSELIKKMERWYDVNIIVAPDVEYLERFTITIKTESLKEMMEILKKVSSNIDYKIDNDNVYVYKKGGNAEIK
ncbi:MAG: FecR family protein [Cellulophaga sp.]